MLKRLQNQPEAVRWQIAGLITIVAAVALVTGWLLFLLPAQLAWVRSSEPADKEMASGPTSTTEALTVEQLQQVLGTQALPTGRQDQKP